MRAKLPSRSLDMDIYSVSNSGQTGAQGRKTTAGSGLRTRGQTGLTANFRQNAPEIHASLVCPWAVPVILIVLNMANPKYAASGKPVPVAELVDTLSDGTKVKIRSPRMRACNEKDAKEKLCAGHLKRWYFFGEELKKKFGADVEIYRCEHWKTLYLPNPEEEPRTGTLSF